MPRLRERTATDSRNQKRAGSGPQRSSVRGLYAEARRHSTSTRAHAQRRHSRGGANRGDAARTTRSLVRTPVAKRDAGLHLSSQVGADRTRLAPFPQYLLRSNRLLDLHVASSEPSKLAYWSTRAGASGILHVFQNGAGELSPADGKEATGFLGDGGKASRRRIANDGSGRRPADRDGTRACHKARRRRAGSR